MVKVEVIENFHLEKFNELKNIIRKAVDEPNKLFVGDIFECTPDMAKYLMGENALKRPFVRVIEIITVNEEPKIRKSSKNILEKRSREKST